MSTILALGCIVGCASRAAPPSGLTNYRSVSELEWTPLNPARGHASPRAATLWGDRTDSGPSGFLVMFADGFSSPPHIHNVSYRAVVLSGKIHNDDSGAEPMWMNPGSFWTQPLGQAHITSSRGASMAYVEIDDGPYLVHPAEQAHEVAQMPVNLDVSNLVWARSPVGGAYVARLWGQPDEADGGVMVRLRSGASVRIEAEKTLKAVVVQGKARTGADGSPPAVAPGSLLSGADLIVGCEPDEMEEPCVFYVRATAGFALGPTEP